MKEIRTCRECGNRLLGRADQKFCSDLCRNTCNNRLTAFKNNTIRNINHTLSRNRRILARLCPAATAKVMRQNLSGFDFGYFTHLRKTPKGKICYFIYDMGYVTLENGTILIVRRPED